MDVYFWLEQALSIVDITNFLIREKEPLKSCESIEGLEKLSL